MKKLLFAVLFSSLMFGAFLPNKTYTCTTLGVSFKDGNQTRNVPNNKETQKELRNTLKNLYSIKINIDKKMLNIEAGKSSDTLAYIKKFKTLDVYITADKQVVLFLDSNKTQVGMMIPSQKTMIYYQCK